MAQAAEQGWYVGGGLGSGQVSYNSNDFVLVGTDPLLAAVQESSDKRPGAYKFFVGYSVSQYWGVEAAYLNIGKFRYRYTDPAVGSMQDEINVTGFNFSLVGTYPVTDAFTLLGKVGAFRSTATNNTSADANWNSPANYAAWTTVGQSSATRPCVSSGLGVGYSLNNNLSLRGEYEYFREVGDAINVGRMALSLWSLSAIYKF